ncbi:hypothetical protein MUK42_26617 [Musa troglodytarum]|uniref:Uncharacterized protein n=1 Tax=Musa troglodytarum TaxID=320322 RepID=A0A9E7F435_9LILI|nr:hypothetical protein MUK42_26617 [Musa troglodytarum]
MKPMSSVGAGFINRDHGSKLRESKAEFTPIGVMLGLLLMALSIGAHTGRQQLVHSPGVRVSKKKRELTAEVEEPEHVAGEADRFVTKSFSRKVAHLQDFDAVRSDPSPPSIRSISVPTHLSVRYFSRLHLRATETSKTDGVTPPRGQRSNGVGFGILLLCFCFRYQPTNYCLRQIESVRSCSPTILFETDRGCSFLL